MTERFTSFVTGITTCYKYIQRIKSAEMTGFGLKGTHAMCLFFLHHNPDGLTAAQLCQLCGEDKAAISRTLSSLQSKGYVNAEEKKYRALLRLTPAGEEVARHMDKLIDQWVEASSAGLGDDERAVFYHALELISNNIRDNLDKRSR